MSGKFSRFLILTLLGFVGISLLVVMGSLYGIVSRTMTLEFYNRLLVQQTNVSVTLQDRLHHVEKQVHKMCMDNAIRINLMLGLKTKVMELIHDHYPFSNGAFFFVQEKENNTFIPEIPKRFNELIPHFQMLKQENYFVSIKFQNFGHETFYSLFSMPIERKNEFLGTIYAVYDLALDTNFWGQVNINLSNRLLIHHNNIITDLRTGRVLPLTKDMTELFTKGIDTPRFDVIPGEIIVPLKEFSSLFYAESSKPLYTKKKELIINLTGLFSIIFGMTLLIAFQIARKVSEPLESMGNQALEIAEELSPCFLHEDGIRHTEFRNLAQAFNHVLKCFLDAQEELKQKARQQIDASEKRYQALVESSPAGILSVDKDWNICFANQTVLQMTGYSEQELCTMTLKCLFYSDDEWEKINLSFPSWSLGAREGSDPEARENSGVGTKDTSDKHPQKKTETRWISRNSKEIWVELRLIPLWEDNNDPFVQVYVMDITQSKHIQDEHTRLATAVEQAVESVFITDMNRVIQYVNPAFEKTTGFSREEAIGKKPNIIWSHRHDITFYQEMWDTLKDGEVWTGHIINRKKDGTIYETETTVSPIRDSSGRIVNYVYIKRDVSREILLQNQLNQAQKIQAIGTLAGGIAHDFNNILAAIMGYTEMSLAEAPPDTQIPRRLERVLNACQRAKELVNQILTFSRQTEEERKSLQISLIVKEALKLLRASLPTTIEIRQDIRDKNGVILANAVQIHQVLMNLCTNASHAMQEKGGVLEISLDSANFDTDALNRYLEIKPGNYMRLSVSDTGHGMDKNTLERIFEPFFTTKKPGEGTGMGLAVVHGIVKSHNGAIRVYSEVGKGTIFHVFFPKVETSITEAEKQSSVLPEGKECILVVDDEEFLVDIAHEMLESLGYTVISQTSSPEALNIFLKQPERFDLVITDHTMPQMTGIELSQKLLEIRPDIPIILCTGFTKSITPEKAREIGIREYIMKPFIKSELAKIVRKVIDGSEK